MSDEELADTIEEANRKKRHSSWPKNPHRWTIIISSLQFIVITLVLGIGGSYIARKAQRDAVLREVSTLYTHLDDSNPNSYRPATERLANLGPDGTEAILKYVKREPCIPWQKARFLHRQIGSFALNDEERRTAGELILNSWMCYRYDPGLDAEFYEILKNEANLTCPLILSNLEQLNDFRSGETAVIPGAALLVLLEKACPGRSSRQLEDFKSRFNKNLESEIAEYGEVIELKSEWFEPWGISGPSIATAGPFDANDSTWRPITLGIYDVFSKRGAAGTAVMWHRLEQDEGLPARLIFGQLILYFDKDQTINQEARSQFDTLVELGLRPASDPESKFAAISAVANLDLKSHKQSLERLADSDEDPRLRRWARNALGYVFSHNPPSSPKLNR